ncbi:hypothetical protein BX616_002466 [Lobosporangium transversale]|uniref:F-box domain-containing protein n=1 Tax=Lobosporangium transversale TaxID=64571 RepID=A0A1Y2GYG8_9FUNG|nr:hypothetical protein BCR41DRAFT_419769 [Lobosporangium transversale]KAF9900885.1 hypothetical protein BX616_002466 [Lobosporangium transversale]ORZ26811.1 hypothetical protein BCR41DRAFT_419769 [Lobosporangium transversale]|eukprot:XP_021884574.1 hypothetical protein BCR41DRAFT_419769 [Lobosporangium transversale]
MFKYVKDILESIRQVSEDDLFEAHVSHRQHVPRMRIRNSTSHPSALASKAVVPQQRHMLLHSSCLNPLAKVPSPLCASGRSESDLSTQKRAFQLPYEIIMLVFQYLPASDLFSVVAVNRLWRQIALTETRHIDLSECFPMDCLGLGLNKEEVYSDFDFVFNLFSMFPRISSLVIRDRYMRDRDLRVVTAGILAGKMAFTTATSGPPVGSEAYLNAQQAIARRKQHQHQQAPIQVQSQQRPDQLFLIKSTTQDFEPFLPTSSLTSSTKPLTKVMRGTINEELREFSRSVGTYVLIPRTRNTLRKKILERFERNLEQKEIQEYCWMIENGFDPCTFLSSTASSFITKSTHSDLINGSKGYPLVPMTHYRFQDCCFANDWGAVMDVNKLPMIGLAAAISGQGLVVDLEGSYGAPSRSIKSMLGFCFGARCVLSLDLGFRHTHMELEDVIELLSENPILYKIDIVDSPAYHELIRLPALRGFGNLLERMQEACLNLDERELDLALQQAKQLLVELKTALDQEEAAHKDRSIHLRESSSSPLSAPLSSPLPSRSLGLPVDSPLNNYSDLSRPMESLLGQLEFPEDTSEKDKLRTVEVLLKGVIHHGIVGLINTRDHNSGQALLHMLAWRRSYSSTMAALAMNPSSSPKEGGNILKELTPQSLLQQPTSPFLLSSSFPRHCPSSTLTSTGLGAGGFVSSTLQTLSGSLESAEDPMPSSSLSGLSSLISIRSIPAVLSSALSFRRLSLPSTLWIPEDSEDIGVGGGTYPTPDEEDTYVNGYFDAGDLLENNNSNSNSVVMQGPSPVEGKQRQVEGAIDALVEGSQPGIPTPCTTPPMPATKAKVTTTSESLSATEPEIPEHHPVAVALRMAKRLLELKADPNVYNKDGRSAVVCASYMGFQPMEALLIEYGGYSKELIRIRETM